LIDCGVVLGTVDPKGVMTAVAKDILAETKKNLDVLVITHEHWDHLSGFDAKQARAVFRQLKIGALWLAWTEDETDGLAKSLREERERRKQAAKAAKEAAKKRGLKRQAQRLTELLGFFGANAAGDPNAEEDDAGGTAGAFTFLKQKCRPTILETGTTSDLPGVNNVRVYILGPPKDADALRKAMSIGGAYLAQDEDRVPYQYTPDFSRRARGIEVWAALRQLGRPGLADLIERTCRCAGQFAEGLRAAGYCVLNEVVLNQVLVSFGSSERTREVIARVQRDGTCWCGGTVWQGHTAMRISVSSWATTEADVERSLAAILRAASY